MLNVEPIRVETEIRDARVELSRRARRQVVHMARRGGCFIGSALSCLDIIAHLYTRVLRVYPDTLRESERDYFLLSKGHAVPALYAVLAELRYFAPERLANHLQRTDDIYLHPNRAIPGIEFHSGSLGHLLSVGIGIAIDLELCRGSNRVFVMMGDGELNEGSIWEALLVAGTRGLDKLVTIVDRNGLQANLPTEQLVPLEPLAAKLESFGWQVQEIDGHDFGELEQGFAALPVEPGKPTAVIAHTVRGKGIASIEGRTDRWFMQIDGEQERRLLEEIETAAGAGR